MQEQLFGQLVQTLEERAGLDAEKATEVANIVAEFAQQHLPDLIKVASSEGMGGVLGGLGGLFGGRR